MADLAETVRRLIRDNTLTLTEYTVAAVGADYTVDLEFGNGVVTAVPCASSYPTRNVGDKVLVIQLQGGTWQVIAKSEADQAQAPVTQADLNAAIDNSEVALQKMIPPEVTLTYGTAAVPPTYQVPVALGFRDLGGGKFDIYVQTSTPTTTSIKPAAGLSRPRPVTVNPTSQGSWRTSGEIVTGILQGDPDGLGVWTGALFYGTTIQAAVAGKSVGTITMSLTREDGGIIGPVPVRAYLHNSTVGPPVAIADQTVPFSLRPGEMNLWTVPPLWTAQLAAGSAQGVMFTSADPDDYLALSGGQVTISYSPA